MCISSRFKLLNILANFGNPLSPFNIATNPSGGFHPEPRSKSIQLPYFKEQKDEVRQEGNTALVIPLYSDLQQLDETVKSMMETSLNLVSIGKTRSRGKICKVCGKEGRGIDIMRHIEANHLEGVSIPCNQCEKIFRSRDTLRHHVSKHNRQY